MSASPLETVQSLYGAFGKGDVPRFLALLDPHVCWRFNGNAGLAYSREARGPAEVGVWLGQVMEVDDIQAFEPREFLPGDRHVTVLGWERTRDRKTGRVFESDWVHVFEVADARVTRFWGMYDTELAAASR